MKRRLDGFTIIELLAAMAVLLIMVALLSRVFGSAASTWKSGNKRIESNNTGRSAMEFMARELAGLITSADFPSFKLDSNADDFLGMESDRLTFVTLSHRAEYRGSKYRDVQQVHYAIAEIPGENGRYGLYRWVTEDSDSAFFTSYEDKDWYTSAANQSPSVLWCALLAENVRSFEVFITPVGSDTPQSEYSTSDGPPAAIDIYLEVLAEEDATRASLTPSDTAFLIAATRRYATRIYIQNRAGYTEQ